ncbi:MAG: peroxiredoxin [Sulfuricurvum sp.]|uniref:peroxiredoxin n=1 Tax=Sulfuricurvum sp. TaxID=2025608 RepID=UPI00262FDD85|nr:peroxiredoxin [Sulfuricurvum sp.]MDD2828191.1 peroxiredoxin [Sulfuricurvum sp.]MDD4949854.1 peroxiredoxin [Sulfuricurvum sp.]
MLELESTAPDFCLSNQDDVEICSRDLRGKWIVLYFYPKDSTPGCTTEACEFSTAVDAYDDMGAIILGVSADSTKSHRNFIEKKSLEITLLSDPTTQMMQDYGVWAMKKNYGKEYMGIVRSTYIIDPQGVVKAAWTNVKVKDHVMKVKEELMKLQG